MKWKRRTWGLIVGCAALVMWLGYSFWVMQLHERVGSKRAVMQVASQVAPGSTTLLRVVVADMETDEPVKGERVVLMMGDDPPEEIARGVTDEAGIFEFEVEVPGEERRVEVEAYVGEGSWVQRPTGHFEVERRASLVVTTDKPRYQPGQKIEIRALLRDEAGRPLQDDVQIKVLDPRGTAFFDRSLPGNEFGMLQASFPLSSVAPEGPYRVVAGFGEVEQETTVVVEHYTLPRFEVRAEWEKPFYGAGDTVEVEIEGRYFFGRPVAGGQFRLRGFLEAGGGDEFVEISGELDDEGRQQVSVELPDYFVGDPDNHGLAHAHIEVELVDGAGDAEVVQKALTVAGQELVIDAFVAGGAMVPGVPNTVWVVTRSPVGRPVAAEVVARGRGGYGAHRLETNQVGVGSFSFVPVVQSQATFEMEARTSVDPVSGEPATREVVGSATHELVTGAGSSLALIVERPAYQVGDRLVGEVLSRRGQGRVFVDIVSGGRTVATEVVRLEEHRGQIDLEITPAMRGTLELRAWSFAPEVAQTAARVLISDADALSLKVSPDREEYRPGDPAVFRIETSEKGSPVPASVGLDIVDESVFAVGGRGSRMGAVAYQLDGELLQPRAWLYGVRPAELLKPSPTEGGSMPHCAVIEPHHQPAVNFVDGHRLLMQEIRDRQEGNKTVNMVLLVLFLLTIPVGLAIWVFVHRPRELAPRELVSRGATSALVLSVFAAGLVPLVSLLSFVLGDEWILMGACGAAVLLLIATAAARSGAEDGRLWIGLAALISMHLALIVLGQRFFEGIPWYRELGEVVITLILFPGVLIPLSLAALVGQHLDRGKRRFAIAPAAVGLLYGAVLFGLAMVESRLIVMGLVLLALAPIPVIWAMEQRDGAPRPEWGYFFKGGLASAMTMALWVPALFGIALIELTLSLAGLQMMVLAMIAGPMLITTVFAVVRLKDWVTTVVGAAYLAMVSLFMLEVMVIESLNFDGVDVLLILAALAVMFGALIYVVGRNLALDEDWMALGPAMAGGLLLLPLAATCLAALFSCQYDQQEFMVGSPAMDEVSGVSLDYMASIADEEDAEPGPTGEGEIRVRQYFPETLFSDIVITDEHGVATVELAMADSITNWKVDALGVASSGAVGSAGADAVVFQPVFVEPQLPVSLTQGDVVEVPLSVFNYSDEELDIELSAEAPGWAQLRSGRHQLRLGPNEVGSVELEITATNHGTHHLMWTARASNSDGEEIFGDALRREVVVEPRGQRISSYSSGPVAESAAIAVEVPEQAVEGSAMAVVELAPGIMGQIVEGMDAMLAMPTGCFEQTTSTLYPNAMALAYLEANDLSNPELQARAENYIARGYQRLLSFEAGQGGYSLFSGRPARPVVSAYGLQMLADIDAVYPVDKDRMEEMYGYVARSQLRDGSWEADDKSGYLVGVTDDFGMTAFVALSLASYDQDSPALAKAMEYLRGELDVDEMGTRDLARVLHLVVEMDSDRELRQRLVRTLVERAVGDTDEAYWGDRSSTAGIEDTAFATLALVKAQQEPGLAARGLAFLASSKSARGWGTTQATVAALRALILATNEVMEVTSGELAIYRDGEAKWTISLDEATSGEAHLAYFELGSGESEVVIRGPEGSGYNYRLETRYHLPWDQVAPEQREMEIAVDYDHTELRVEDRVEVTVTIDVEDREVGMAIVDVGIPPGFTVDRPSLRHHLEGDLLGEYEVMGRQVILYLENLQGRQELSFSIIAGQPIRASSGASEAYDYYSPERRAVTGPVDVVVR